MDDVWQFKKKLFNANKTKLRKTHFESESAGCHSTTNKRQTHGPAGALVWLFDCHGNGDQET